MTTTDDILKEMENMKKLKPLTVTDRQTANRDRNQFGISAYETQSQANKRPKE